MKEEELPRDVVNVVVGLLDIPSKTYQVKQIPQSIAHHIITIALTLQLPARGRGRGGLEGDGAGGRVDLFKHNLIIFNQQ